MKFPKKKIEENLWEMTREGKRIRYCGFVFWANATTKEIYALSEDAYDNGVIDGYKVADISDDFTTVERVEA